MLDLTPIAIVGAIVVVPSAAAVLACRGFGMGWSWQTCGCVGIAVLFVLAGVAHFVVPAQFVKILPAWTPVPELLVYATGVCEVAGGVGVLVARLRRSAGWALVVFLICITPANVYGAMNHVDVAGHGAGPVYLWVRLPLQAFLIGWVWWFAARRAENACGDEHSDA